MNFDEFYKIPLMGILRGIRRESVAPLVETIIESGLKTIEIAMNTENASLIIKDIINCSDGELYVGAGTVTDIERLKIALSAGAQFIVIPTLIKEVVLYCREHNIPVFPGALTPKEIYEAWNNGATMVKVFPVKFFGPEYIKEIQGPFDEIRLLACGGISPDNIGEFFRCGSSAVAFGESVFKKDMIDNKDFNGIKENIKKLIEKYNETIL